MRNEFNAELRELGMLLTDMASVAEKAIDLVTASLDPAKQGSAQEALSLTKNMDQMEREIENRCVKLLLKQQPVARDLRVISAAMKMVTDLQRIGDQCANIAETSRFLTARGESPKLEKIRSMSVRSGAMVKQAIAAYVANDLEAADRVVRLDDEVDALFLEVKGELVDLIAGNRREADQAIDLLMTAKYLERIADHAVNIAQWAIYCVTGELQPTN